MAEGKEIDAANSPVNESEIMKELDGFCRKLGVDKITQSNTEWATQPKTVTRHIITRPTIQQLSGDAIVTTKKFARESADIRWIVLFVCKERVRVLSLKRP